MLYGIIGRGPAQAKLLSDQLNDIAARAVAEDPEEFWYVIGIDGEPSESQIAILDHLAKAETYHEIVCTSPEAIGEAFANTASKVTKIKTPYNKVVDLLTKDADGRNLLVLLDTDDEADLDLVMPAIEKITEAEIKALDLADALTEIGLGDDDDEGEGEGTDEGGADDEDGITAEDLLALGEAGDGEDGDAIESLNALAAESDLDPDEFPTWTELAEAILAKLTEDEEEPEAAEPETDAATKWTAEELGEKDLKTLREMGRAHGIASTSKADIIKALLKKGNDDAEPEETPSKAPASRSTKAPASKAPSTTEAGGLTDSQKATLAAIGAMLVEAFGE
jgi:hypothetical protein